MSRNSLLETGAKSELSGCGFESSCSHLNFLNNHNAPLLNFRFLCCLKSSQYSLSHNDQKTYTISVSVFKTNFLLRIISSSRSIFEISPSIAIFCRLRCLPCNKQFDIKTYEMPSSQKKLKGQLLKKLLISNS